MNGFLKLIVCGLVLAGAYGCWRSHLSPLGFVPETFLPQPAFRRVSSGALSFESPCGLAINRSIPIAPDDARFTSQNEFLTGRARGCVVLVQHSVLTVPRDPASLNREAEAKVASLRKTYTITSRRGPVPIVVAGTRAERLSCTLVRDGQTTMFDRLTIPRNRDFWMIIVFNTTSQEQTRSDLFEHILSSIRL